LQRTQPIQFRLFLALLVSLASFGRPIAAAGQTADYYRGTMVNAETPEAPAALELAIIQRSDSSTVGWLQIAPPLRGSGPAGVLLRDPDSLYLASLSMAGDTILWVSATRTGTLSGKYRVLGGENAGQRGSWRLEPRTRTPATKLLVGAVFGALAGFLFVVVVVVNARDHWWRWRGGSSSVRGESELRKLSGVRGWVLVFVLCQAVLLIYEVVMATELQAIFGGTWMLGIALPHLRAMLFIQSATQLLQLIGVSTGLVLVFRKSPSAPAYWIVLFVLMSLSAIYDAAAAAWVVPILRKLFGPGNTSIADDIDHQMRLNVGLIAYAIAWAAYWIRSERVRVLFSPTTRQLRGAARVASHEQAPTVA
jgi:hypothetical protein